MRLFIAINFSKEVKDRLAQMQDRLREKSLKGNFTRYENLHLTLVFLGEVDGGRVGVLKEILAETAFAPFTLRIEGIGSFRREGGDILWAGVAANPALSEVYDRLCMALSQAGFKLERGKYTPHLTLAREARLQGGLDKAALSKDLGVIETTVAKISLMKSERIGGRLTYTEIV